VFVLDENILESQRRLLRSRGISVRQIGLDTGRKGMSDEEILSFLLTLPSPTFFTRDLGLLGRPFCHARYCLVALAVGQGEAACFARRFLRHRAFSTQARRMGAVVRVMTTGMAA
jgi:hypothetical protein